jgi:hypothetical protein
MAAGKGAEPATETLPAAVGNARRQKDDPTIAFFSFSLSFRRIRPSFNDKYEPVKSALLKSL